LLRQMGVVNNRKPQTPAERLKRPLAASLGSQTTDPDSNPTACHASLRSSFWLDASGYSLLEPS
jgi:hypothetical protein